MFGFHPIAPPHPAGGLHFEVHRSALAEAVADVAWGATWVAFWLLFLALLAS